MSAAEFAPGPWTAVANSWQITTIYDANSMCVCRLDLEDWGVDEDNQQELERHQTEVAQRIVAAAASVAKARGEEKEALVALVAVLREYGTFPPKVWPALRAAELALGMAPPAAAIRASAPGAATVDGVTEGSRDD